MMIKYSNPHLLIKIHLQHDKFCFPFMMIFDLIELMLIVPPSGIPTDEEQATGMERIIMKAMQEGSVRLLI